MNCNRILENMHCHNIRMFVKIHIESVLKRSGSEFGALTPSVSNNSILRQRVWLLYIKTSARSNVIRILNSVFCSFSDFRTPAFNTSVRPCLIRFSYLFVIFRFTFPSPLAAAIGKNSTFFFQGFRGSPNLGL